MLGALLGLVPGWWTPVAGQTERLSAPSNPASSPPAWRVVSSPNAGATDVLAGVSCVSSSFCMAVGTYSRSVGSADLALFEMWDGEKWSIVPGSPDAPGPLQMSAISCASDDFCLAVGTVYQTDIVTERWNGTAWSVVPSVDPPDSYIAVGLKGLSCATSRTCVAVGDVLGGGSYKTFVESWDGSWVIEPSPDPGPYAVLTDVSCTTTGGTLCIAGGEYGESEANTTHAFLAKSDGSGWSVAVTVHAIAANASFFSGVSCSSDRQCAAVGTYDVAGEGSLLDDNWNGSTWTLLHAARPTAVAVSCLSATNCDDLGSSGYVWTWNGSAWTQLAKSQSGGGTYFSLSCAPRLCAAVGSGSGSGGASKTAVEQACSAARSSTADVLAADAASTSGCGRRHRERPSVASSTRSPRLRRPRRSVIERLVAPPARPYRAARPPAPLPPAPLLVPPHPSGRRSGTPGLTGPRRRAAR